MNRRRKQYAAWINLGWMVPGFGVIDQDSEWASKFGDKLINNKHEGWHLGRNRLWPRGGGAALSGPTHGCDEKTPYL